MVKTLCNVADCGLPRMGFVRLHTVAYIWPISVCVVRTWSFGFFTRPLCEEICPSWSGNRTEVTRRRAAANLQLDMVTHQGRPLWSFGGQGRKRANVGVHTKTRTMEISQVCAPPREKRTCQPKLVRARSVGPGTLLALQQLLALSSAPWSRLSDTASTGPSFMLDLFSANTDLQRFFLNRRIQCARLDLFFVMTPKKYRR